MSKFWKQLLAIFGFLFFRSFGAKADELPPPMNFAELKAADVQEELTRKSEFMAEKRQSADTFDYHKSIFITWITDMKTNKELFCAQGYKPMTKEDLVFARDFLTEFTNEIDSELSKRV